jgi:hypothetical protein
VPITLKTPQGDYQGGLRNYAGKGWPYLCPNLISSTTGKRVNLARILRDNRVSPGDTIIVNVSGSNWTLA